MAQTTVSVRMDDALKRDFDEVCNELGLSMTTAITMLAKKMTREKRLPFEVSVDPFYSDENMARLRKSIAQMESTGGTIHEITPESTPIEIEFFQFYRTPRGEVTPKGATPLTTTHPTLTSNVKFMNFYPFEDLEVISPRPLLFIG